jgi:hypothetical protein
VVTVSKELSMKVVRFAFVALAAFSFACGGDKPEENVPPLELSTSALADGKLGEAMSITLEAKGGTPPYVFTATGLPAGLDLSGAILSGTPTAPGRVTVELKVSDSAGRTAMKTLELYVVPDPLAIVTTTIVGGKQGTPYSETLVARGGVPPLTWSLASGTLPAGILVESTGALSGTPTEFGIFNFSVRVTDAEDTKRDLALVLTLSALNPMVLTSSVPRGRVDQAYETQLEAEGGEMPYRWAIAAGALPMGVTLAQNGELAGTPTEGGDFTFSVRVTDGSTPPRMDMQQLGMNVIAALAIETTDLAQALSGRPYTFAMEASGGVPPYTWSLGAGTLPAGITFDANGTLSGTTMAGGDYELTIRVRDAEGLQRSGLFTLRISDRFTYEVRPRIPVPVPPVCTSTQVSYVMIPIVVNESYQISDLNISVDASYTWNENAQTMIRNRQRTPGTPRIILFAPDGRQAVLCGNGAAIPGGPECTAQDMNRDWDDDGAQANRPERPLSVFDGMNARGTWTLAFGVAEPRCQFTGSISNVELSIQDESNTDPYVVVTGHRRNNLVTGPFLRTCTPDCGGEVENELFLNATVYDVGANGFPEGGEGDDNDLGIVMTWAWNGNAIDGVTLDPDGHVLVSNSNHFGCQQENCAGTGQRTIVASGAGYMASVVLRVLPPEWNVQTREY